ncbi:putative DNA binding domain-containing protein [Leeuwenhoekiella palythoae]|uniref:RNA-binding domain-containing protein n=1 Tax=Leeuwenhoekiella palythoae TaxID=573501 RepID=UPI001CE1B541|nr:RNA-binding domain-containing protein [Leeuwenhoekiella palythoae]UBZ10923.1 putative DNA binding domain-containing protein [Leeuwenhoekiella palythoae]
MIDLKLFERLKLESSEKYESETLEFKNFKDANSLNNSKELCDEISALANTKGGTIIIGIKDFNDIKHNNFQDQLDGFEVIDLDVTKERIRGKLKPKIDVKLFYINFESKNYLIIEVPRINYSLVTTSSGKVYIREGKSSVPAEPNQIQELVNNLQTYDWSSKDINVENFENLLDKIALREAKIDFANRRNINVDNLTDLAFLESINATKNGILNNAGLLFLGTKDTIEKYLGNYEYRFSWRTNSGILITNEVWNDCIWKSIKIVKNHFNNCNSVQKLEYNKQKYELNLLDEQAFHEAFLNSIVHRDYSIDGMISINFKGDELIISNPGTFYGGVNEDNISYHEPRHRNKILAKLLMTFQLVDRAGMGVLRISLNSLKYGRDFPQWKENQNTVEVKMPSEYIKVPIFILTQKYLTDCSIMDLYIINKLYEKGFVSVTELELDLKNIFKNPWNEILKTFKNEKILEYIEFKGTNDGLFICATEIGKIWLDVNKKFKIPSNSEKHVKLYQYLKKHKVASNEDIMNLLDFSRASVTSNFLAKLKYVKNSGKSRASRWSLK